jgi:hypothetical protein
VRDVVTELRAFAANVAYLCHDFTPNLCVSCCRLQPQRWLFGPLKLGLSLEALSRRASKHANGSLPNLQYTRNPLDQQGCALKTGEKGLSKSARPLLELARHDEFRAGSPLRNEAQRLTDVTERFNAEQAQLKGRVPAPMTIAK